MYSKGSEKSLRSMANTTISAFLKKYLFLIVIVALMIVAYSTGITDLLSFKTLKEHRDILQEFVNNHYVTSLILYTLIYFVATSLSLPGAAILTIFGGFLIPVPWSTICVIIGATAGATVIFMAARTALGDMLKARSGKMLQKMEKGFKEHAVSYLFFLRLVPLFPFWVVNLAPAFFGVRLKHYVWTTFFGIMPGCYIYTQAGAGLSEVFNSGEAFTIENILNWKMRIALILLAVFALIPVIYRRIKRAKS
ncbi:MAG: hypothetical protein SP1CHLAM54_01730 [Chlamydiia bacterium]|nr:hypothetical protein [Chlamydiia bacterium]MCH9615091.1 hypothetical protein [Chlamydiia bacterium]MCH9628587.1 hypothetical protein [Chlamydiia bacterium]